MNCGHSGGNVISDRHQHTNTLQTRVRKSSDSPDVSTLKSKVSYFFLTFFSPQLNGPGDSKNASVTFRTLAGHGERVETNQQGLDSR